MSVLATDTFDRADASDLGTTWTVVPFQNSMKIVSNTAQASLLTSGDNAEYYNTGTWPDDQYAQSKLAVTGGANGNGEGPGVAVRCSTTVQSIYRCVVNKAGTSNVEVSKFVTNTYTQLGQRTQAWTDGDILRLEVSGTSIKALRNGTQLGATITDAALTTGRPGVCHSGGSSISAGSLNDWEGGDFAGGSPATPQQNLFVRTVAVPRASLF